MPRPRLAQAFFELDTKPGLGRTARPRRAARAGLNAIPAQKPELLALDTEIPKARNVGAGWSATVDVLIHQPRDDATRTGLGEMVHDVVTNLAARVGEARWETGAPRVEKNLRRPKRRGIEKHDARIILARLSRVGVDHAHAGDAVFLIVVQHALDDRVSDERELARRSCGGKRRALG